MLLLHARYNANSSSGASTGVSAPKPSVIGSCSCGLIDIRLSEARGIAPHPNTLLPITGSPFAAPRRAGVTVWLKLTGDHYGADAEQAAMFELEDRLVDEMRRRRVGAFQGNEFGGGFCKIVLNTTNPDQLIELVTDVLETFPISPGSHLIKHGKRKNDPEERIELNTTA